MNVPRMQPTTVVGIAAILAAATVYAISLYRGCPLYEVTGALVVFGLTSAGISDNSGVVKPLEKFGEDAITALVMQRLGPMLPTLGQDTIDLMRAAVATPGGLHLATIGQTLSADLDLTPEMQAKIETLVKTIIQQIRPNTLAPAGIPAPSLPSA
jgi:hypothetical protein